MYAKVKETYSRKNSTFGPVLKFQMASILNVDTVRKWWENGQQRKRLQSYKTFWKNILL